MFERLLSRKTEFETEVTTPSELRNELAELKEIKEEELSNFILQKTPEAKEHVNALILGIERFNPSDLYPQFQGVGSSFKSTVSKLWRNVDPDNFEEIERAVEKTAKMKAKHYNVLFALNPPEIEAIDKTLSKIVSITDGVEEKRDETKIGVIDHALEKLNRLEELIDEKENLKSETNEILFQIENYSKIEDDGKEAKWEKLSELENNLKQVEEEMQSREKKVQEIAAIARRPLKKYAHMIGEKVSIGLEDFAKDQVTLIASNAASEILKGNINLKEKQIKEALISLNSISKGEVKQELERIGELKEEQHELKNSIRKLKMGRNRGEQSKIESLEKEMELCEVKMSKIEEEIGEAQRDLEENAGEVFGHQIELELSI